MAMTFEDNTFGTVWSTRTLEHVPIPKQAFADSRAGPQKMLLLPEL
jgi:hypothetical protein